MRRSTDWGVGRLMSDRGMGKMMLHLWDGIDKLLAMRLIGGF